VHKVGNKIESYVNTGPKAGHADSGS